MKVGFLPRINKKTKFLLFTFFSLFLLPYYNLQIISNIRIPLTCKMKINNRTDTSFLKTIIKSYQNSRILKHMIHIIYSFESVDQKFRLHYVRSPNLHLRLHCPISQPITNFTYSLERSKRPLFFCFHLP